MERKEKKSRRKEGEAIEINKNEREKRVKMGPKEAKRKKFKVRGLGWPRGQEEESRL